MLDPQVIVHVLPTAQNVQPVERAIASFPVEQHVDIVANQSAVGGHDVQRNRAVAQLRELHEPDVAGRLGLANKLGVLEHGVLADNDFRNRVRPTGTVAQTDVTLDDRCLTVRLRDDQAARMRYLAFALRMRDEHHVNRRVQAGAPRNVQPRAVAQKGCVQRTKRMLVVGRMPGQVAFYGGVARRRRFGQTPHHDAVRKRADGRQVRCISTVDEDQPPDSGVPAGRFGEVRGGQSRSIRIGQSIAALRDRPHVGVSPLLVTGRGKAQRLEPLDRRLANPGQPRRITAVRTEARLETIEVGTVNVVFTLNVNHRHAGCPHYDAAAWPTEASSSIQA